MRKKQTTLLTGGTGSFGEAFIAYMLSKASFNGVIRVYSRDEFKQHHLMLKFNNDKRLRFFIGDVRDLSRLNRATDGADLIIHAAALKQVPILEYNPFEAVKTNILGTQNVIESAIDANVRKAILISSDKACAPINLYGATKMVAEKLFIQGNAYAGKKNIKFSVVRYGNVMASRGSVLPMFLNQVESKTLTITDSRMTRFWITLEQGVKFVIRCTEIMQGGEIFVPKIPSIKIVDLAKAINSKARIRIIGIRPGEKLNEILISKDEARHTREFRDHFIIEPEFAWWGLKKIKEKNKRLTEAFIYTSDTNKDWLTIPKIKKLLKQFRIGNND